jgi:hypothetical protein
MAKNQREEILEIIKSGRAAMVPVNGRIRIFTIDNIDKLPNEADLAVGNPEQEKAALASIDEQIKALEDAKKRLAANQKAEAKAVETQAKEQEETAVKAEEETKARASKEEPKAASKKEETK